MEPYLFESPASHTDHAGTNDSLMVLTRLRVEVCAFFPRKIKSSWTYVLRSQLYPLRGHETACSHRSHDGNPGP